MNDVQRDIDGLVAIARVDAQLAACRGQLASLPKRVEELTKQIDAIIVAEKTAKEHLEEMGKERRDTEAALEDDNAKITKYKTQLMSVKTNKEYTAMQHEIAHLEKQIDSKEERLLILMDETEEQQATLDKSMEETTGKRKDLEAERAALESEIKARQADAQGLESQKPALLDALGTAMRKRYERILVKLGNLAVTRVKNGACQGCFTRVPPQRAVEIRQNDQLLACEACGRILVHYED